jgi:hypothetical protein
MDYYTMEGGGSFQRFGGVFLLYSQGKFYAKGGENCWDIQKEKTQKPEELGNWFLRNFDRY